MSFDTNKIIIVGRLTKDPENKTTSIAITKFSIAVNDGKDKASFFNIVTFNKSAENCLKYLKKGSQVIIDGKLSQNRWQDKEGKNKSSVEIIGNNVQFIGGKSDSGQNLSANKDPFQEQAKSEGFTNVDFTEESPEIPF